MFDLLKNILNHPANRDATLSALVFSLHWQIRKRISSRPYDLPYHGLSLRCYPNSHSASRAIYFSGLPDYREMCFMRDFLRPDDCFIDAGANIGLYTLLACSIVEKNGHVHAFEPNPKVASILRESLDLSAVDNVTVYEVGLSDNDGMANFVMTDDDCTAHIVNDKQLNIKHQIPVRRLDQVLDDIPYAMAKFDIEGYEPFAIQGLSKWTEHSNPCVLLIEMAGYSKRHNITTSDFINQLHQIGYFTAIYDPESKEIEPIDRPWEVPVENVLAIAKNRKGFVEERLKNP